MYCYDSERFEMNQIKLAKYNKVNELLLKVYEVNNNSILFSYL